MSSLFSLTPRQSDDPRDIESHIQYFDVCTPHSARQNPSQCSWHRLHIDPEVGEQRTYHLAVDPKQFNRATEIQPCNWLRPHMRIFHLAWMSAIPGFIGWYAIPPMMPVIKEQLHLTSGEVLNSDIAATASTIITRIAVGPMLDAFGPQFVQSWLLWIGAIPVACAAFVSSSMGLLIVRFVIGFIGCIFVSGQYWTTITFAKNVVGASNAITGGVAVAGIGFAFLLLPYVSQLMTIGGHIPDDLAWRVTIALPAVAMLLMGTVVRFATDACPMGDFCDLVIAKNTTVNGNQIQARMGLFQTFAAVLKNRNTLILILQYGMCFGVELQLNNMGALYFYEDFLRPGCSGDDVCHTLSKTQAATVASAFGLMSLFARALGGLASDSMNRKYGMKGRLGIHFVLLCLEGSLVLVLGRTRALGPCIVLYVATAVAAQATGGSTFSIVPYVNEACTGTVAGLVGAGGNLGGALFGVIFRETSTRQEGLLYVGVLVLTSAFAVPLLRVPNTEDHVDASSKTKAQDPGSH